MAENLQVNVTANTGQAQSALETLNRKVEGVSASFGALRNILVGGFVGGMLAQISQLALVMEQAGKATDISLATINQFSKAVSTLGGDAKQATGDILAFFGQVGEARNGMPGAQAELARLGITLVDLGRLSNEELFRKTIDGLAKLDDSAARTGLSMKLLGGEFKKIDIREVANRIQVPPTREETQTARSYESQAAALKNITRIFGELKDALANSTKGIADFVARIDIGTKAIQQAVDFITKFVLVVGSIFVVSRAISLAMTAGGAAISGFVSIWRSAVAAVENSITVIGNLFRNFPIIWSELSLVSGNVFKKIGAIIIAVFQAIIPALTAVGRAISETLLNIFKPFLGETLAKMLFGSFPAVLATVFAALYAFFESVRDMTVTTLNAIVNFAKSVGSTVESIGTGAMMAAKNVVEALTFGLIKFDKVKVDIEPSVKPVKNFQAEVRSVDNEIIAQQKEVEEANVRVIDAQRAIKLELDKVVRAYRDQNVELSRSLQFANTLIGVDETRANRAQKLFDIETQHVNILREMRNKFVEMEEAAKTGNEEQKQQFERYKNAYGPAVAQINKLYGEQVATINKIVTAEEILKNRERERALAIEAINQQIARGITLSERLIGIQDQLSDALAQQSQLRATPLERQLLAITESTRKAALEAGRQFTAAFAEGDDGLSIDQIMERDRGLAEIAKRYYTIGELQRQNIIEEGRLQQLEQGRIVYSEQLVKINEDMRAAMFERAQMGRSPIEQQFENIRESARRASAEASRALVATFEGLSETPENLERLSTGLQRIADQYEIIAKIQIENLQLSRTWEQGWRSAFQDYTQNSENAARKAGDAFRAVTGNMDRMLENFVRTGKLNFNSFARSVIQDLVLIELKAMASSAFKVIGGGLGGLLGGVAGFIGGMFADGGDPPPGKASIVGERGPELFVPKSSGTIVPMDKVGSTTNNVVNHYHNYNYQISAVDSKSVAQLFAENRKTLLGTVQMAQKEMPYSNI